MLSCLLLQPLELVIGGVLGQIMVGLDRWCTWAWLLLMATTPVEGQDPVAPRLLEVLVLNGATELCLKNIYFFTKEIGTYKRLVPLIK